MDLLVSNLRFPYVVVS